MRDGFVLILYIKGIIESLIFQEWFLFFVVDFVLIDCLMLVLLLLMSCLKLMLAVESYYC